LIIGHPQSIEMINTLAAPVPHTARKLNFLIPFPRNRGCIKQMLIYHWDGENLHQLMSTGHKQSYRRLV